MQTSWNIQACSRVLLGPSFSRIDHHHLDVVAHVVAPPRPLSLRSRGPPPIVSRQYSPYQLVPRTARLAYSAPHGSERKSWKKLLQRRLGPSSTAWTLPLSCLCLLIDLWTIFDTLVLIFTRNLRLASPLVSPFPPLVSFPPNNPTCWATSSRTRQRRFVR